MKKLYISALILFFVSTAISFFAHYTLVIPISKLNQKDLPLKKGAIVKPFKNLFLSDGNWKAYIVFDKTDLIELPQGIARATCIKTEDKSVIQEMKDTWHFIYKEGDIATAESSIYIFHDNELVFESAIVISENSQGLQSRSYGWMKPVRKNVICESCKKFKRVYWPVVVL